MPKGDASKLPDETWDTLLDEIATGKRGLSKICESEDMPSASAVYQRIDRDPDFASRFRARKAIGVRAMADDCLEIADEIAVDVLAVQNKRVRIDTRLRLAGKWLAAEYGDKHLIGSDPENPLPAATVSVAGLSEQALRELAALGKK